MLKKLHNSVPANPLLAEPMYLTAYIERLGTGTTDIIKKAKEAGLPEPQFIQDDMFRAVIYKMSGSIGGSIGGSIDKMLVLTKRQREILALIEKNNRISYRNMAVLLKINESAVKKHLNVLKKKSFIRRVGGTRGYWEVLIKK